MQNRIMSTLHLLVSSGRFAQLTLFADRICALEFVLRQTNWNVNYIEIQYMHFFSLFDIQPVVTDSLIKEIPVDGNGWDNLPICSFASTASCYIQFNSELNNQNTNNKNNRASTCVYHLVLILAPSSHFYSFSFKIVIILHYYFRARISCLVETLFSDHLYALRGKISYIRKA